MGAMAGQFVLGVDLDGVVADHTRRFREIVAELRGIDPETLSLERSWDFHEWGFAPDEYDRLHKQAVTEFDMIRTMNVIDGAADALWRLSDAGIWIRIITHRLYVNWAHERAVGDTAAWLDEHRIPYRDLCFLGAKPEVQADAYIDDAPHNIVGPQGARERRDRLRSAIQPSHRGGTASDRLDGSRDDRGGPGRRPVWPRRGATSGDRRGVRPARPAASTGLTSTQRSVTSLQYFPRHRRGDPTTMATPARPADGAAAHALPNL